MRVACVMLVLLTAVCLAQEDGVPRYPGARKVHPGPVTYPDLYSTDDTLAEVDAFYQTRLTGWTREEIHNASSDDGYGISWQKGGWGVHIWKIQGRTFMEIVRDP